MIFDKAQEAANYLIPFLTENIELAIITGTGLNEIIRDIEIQEVISYSDIPHFPECSVQSHGNQLIIGKLEAKTVLAFVGRFHYYEGREMWEITFPVRVLQLLNIKNVLFTNASGGLNSDYKEGDIVLLKDHIYLMPENPLRGQHDERLGLRFPDMSEVYSRVLRTAAKQSAQKLGLKIHEGVYVCWQGPSLETPAEYKYLHGIGADLIGMSTIPEVIVAVQAQMNILTASIVSNVCYPPDQISKTTIEEVIEVCNKASQNLSKLIASIVEDL